MKFLLAILAMVAVANGANLPQVEPKRLTTFGYLTKYGIPEAKRIRKAEEQLIQHDSTNAAGRITGGATSDLGQFPWQAGLVIDVIDVNGNAVCGASLLSASRLVTAAHCWFDGEHQAWRFTVVLGSNFIFHGGERIQTSFVFMHSNWIPELIQNDVAMIHLPQPVTLSDIISPIALPTAADTQLTFAGESAIASGFGRTGTGSANDITSNQQLSHVTLKVITNSVCNIWFLGQIQPSNICTSGSGRVSTCAGDSGGPLAYYRDQKPTLIGITSFGIAFGCDINWPAAFVRVTSYLDFINSHLN